MPSMSGECVKQTYVVSYWVSTEAVTPTRRRNSLNAVCNQMAETKQERMIAPIGSIHHLSLDPPTDVRIPKPLINKSFR